MHSFINRGEGLQGGHIWHGFVTDRRAYTTALRAFRDEFVEATRELSDLRDRFIEYEDATAATRMPDAERWTQAMGNLLVTCEALFTYLKEGTPHDEFQWLIRRDAEEFHKAVVGYIRWHNDAKARLDQICREVAG